MHDLSTLIRERNELLIHALACARVSLPDATITHAAQLWTAIILSIPEFDTTKDRDLAQEILEAFCDRHGDDAELPEEPAQMCAKAAILYTIFPSRTFDAWRGRISSTSI